MYIRTLKKHTTVLKKKKKRILIANSGLHSPEDDVQRVGNLVRVHPDRPGFDPVQSPVKSFRVDPFRVRETGVHQRGREAPERTRQEHHSFPQQGLRKREREEGECPDMTMTCGGRGMVCFLHRAV